MNDPDRMTVKAIPRWRAALVLAYIGLSFILGGLCVAVVPVLAFRAPLWAIIALAILGTIVAAPVILVLLSFFVPGATVIIDRSARTVTSRGILPWFPKTRRLDEFEVVVLSFSKVPAPQYRIGLRDRAGSKGMPVTVAKDGAEARRTAKEIAQFLGLDVVGAGDEESSVAEEQENGNASR